MSPNSFIKAFGKPTSSLPDTYGELIFFSKTLKCAFVIYDYKFKKHHGIVGNPWKKKGKMTFSIGAKHNISREALQSFLLFLKKKKLKVQFFDFNQDVTDAYRRRLSKKSGIAFK